MKIRGGCAGAEQFAGRSEQIHELENRLMATIGGNPQHTAIMGERGIGKTSLLRKFDEIAHDKHCIVARVDLHPGISDLENLLLNLHEELRSSGIAYYGLLGKKFEAARRSLENYSVTLPIAGGGIEKIQERTLETSFRERLMTIWSKVQGKAAAIVLMIDEAEKLTQIVGALEYLRNTFSRLGEQEALYCIVISGKTGLFQAVTETFSPLERFFLPLELEPFTETEVTEALEKATAQTGIEFDRETKEEITRDSEGQPYVMQIYGYYLFNEAARKGIRKVTYELLRTVRPRILGMLETQLFDRRINEGIGRSKHKLKIIRKLAEINKESYSFTEIMKITGVRKEHGLGSYLTELVDAGCLRKDRRTGRYSFFMTIFKRFAAQKLEKLEVA